MSEHQGKIRLKERQEKQKSSRKEGKKSAPRKLAAKWWFIRLLLKIIVVALALYALSCYVILRFTLTPSSKGRDMDGSFISMFSEYPKLKHWTDSLKANGALLESTIYAADSTLLHAYYIPAPRPTRSTAVVVHGYTDNAIHMLHLAYMYHHDLHFNVLLPDLRYAGLSGGDHIQMGLRDSEDVERWIARADSLFSTDTRIVVHGVSMGATAAMLMAGRQQSPHVRCYVEDSGYATLEEQLTHVYGEHHIPSFLFLPGVELLCRWIYGWDMADCDCLASLRRSSLPMLFIHGKADDYVPFKMVYRLYQAKPRDKFIWTPDKVQHARSYHDDAREYTDRVDAFTSMFLY